jgi:chromosome segregation ATPase
LTPAPSKGRSKPKSGPTRAARQDANRRESERALREELADAEQRLRAAEKTLREAERERNAAERTVASLRSKLEHRG